MKVATSELMPPALNWAVGYVLTLAAVDGKPVLARDLMQAAIRNGLSGYSTDWSLGGPLMVEHDIIFRKYHRPDSPEHGKFYAKVCRESGTMIAWSRKDSTGPTPLIAAMRCLVRGHLGEFADVPDELLKD